jgi:PTS system D-glucosamine-specific IIC component
MVVDGTLVQGAQNIYFAQLASKATEQFAVSATRFMSGKFPFMIFGLPAAAYAMYRAAKPEKRKLVGSLLLSAAITSILTGITEPLEFTFLFVAPLMYGVHCILAGLSFMLMHLLGVGVGMTFSGGLIDLTLFGILQGNAKTNWVWVVVVGLAYSVIYYLVFYFMITKMDLKTPGRDEDDGEIKLYTRADVDERKRQKNESDSTSALILSGLGGRENISDIDCCATRLRVTVKDENRVDDDALKKSGASGVIKKGTGVQIIYGPHVSVIKSNLEDYMDGIKRGTESHLSQNGAVTDCTLYAYASGMVVALENVSDEAFSKKILGEGVAIEPDKGVLLSPCDGKITRVFETSHAVNLVSDEGCEILLHIGIDTVKLAGKYFEAHVKDGDSVHKGDKLITFDIEKIKREGYETVIPMVVCNSGDYRSVDIVASGKISAGEKIAEVRS